MLKQCSDTILESPLVPRSQDLWFIKTLKVPDSGLSYGGSGYMSYMGANDAGTHINKRCAKSLQNGLYVKKLVGCLCAETMPKARSRSLGQSLGVSILHGQGLRPCSEIPRKGEHVWSFFQDESASGTLLSGTHPTQQILAWLCSHYQDLRLRR